MAFVSFAVLNMRAMTTCSLNAPSLHVFGALFFRMELIGELVSCLKRLTGFCKTGAVLASEILFLNSPLLCLSTLSGVNVLELRTSLPELSRI